MDNPEAAFQVARFNTNFAKSPWTERIEDRAVVLLHIADVVKPLPPKDAASLLRYAADVLETTI